MPDPAGSHHDRPFEEPVALALLETLSFLPDLVFVVRDRDDHIVWVNDAFLNAVGSPREDVSERSLIELGISIRAASPADPMRGTIDRRAHPTAFDLQVADEPVRRLEGSQHRVSTADEALTVTVVQDVTLRDNLWDEIRASRSRLAHMVGTMPLAVLEVDANFQITDANANAAELLRTTRSDVTGSNLRDAFPDAGEEAFMGSIRRAIASHTSAKMVHLAPSLRTWLEVTFVPHKGGLVVYFADIGAQKRRDVDFERLGALVASTSDAIFSKTLEGTITGWNAAAERMYGYSAEEAIGREVASLLLPHDAPDDTADILAKIRSGEPVKHYETRRLRKDGATLEVSLTVSPIHDETGRLVGASSIARDITHEHEQQRAVKEAEKRYRTLLEQLPVIIYDWRIEGDLVHLSENYVSPQIEQILGFTPKEWMASPSLWVARLHPEDSDRVLAATERSIQEGAPFKQEYRMVAKDGTDVWLHDEARVLERNVDTNTTFMQGVQSDITAEKLAEATIRKNAEDKMQLIQLLAHELFTPITVIQGAALTLRSMAQQLSPEELGDLSDGVASGARRLRRLVKNLAAAAKLDRPEQTTSARPVSLGEILALALVDFDADSELSKISLAPNDEVSSRRTLVDLELAAQAVGVVIENAVAYAAGAAVEVQLSETERRLLINVCDRGPGIPEDKQESIFEPFVQLDPSDTRTHDGLGVGLYLARRVMQLHGGDVDVAARTNGGSIFTLAFILAEPND